MIMFTVIQVGFSLMGQSLFGSNLFAYSTFARSFETLLLMILGNFDYVSMKNAEPIWAPFVSNHTITRGDSDSSRSYSVFRDVHGVYLFHVAEYFLGYFERSIRKRKCATCRRELSWREKECGE